MKTFEVHPIGHIHNTESGMWIELLPEYRPAIQGLQGFGYLNAIWWFSKFDTQQARSILETPKPYQKAPEMLGIFATRSPVRPNPIALSTVQILRIDCEEGRIFVPYIDADDGTPLLDLKPYTPSMDRVESPAVPAWCAHWPKSMEKSGDFDWEGEFTF